jgi:hypothetical protein
MRIEKVITAYETRYFANDGTEWQSEYLCKQYEELLADASSLKKLKFFNSNGEPINIFALKKIPAFCYLVLTEELPHYNYKVVKAIIGNKENDEVSYDLPKFCGVWCNDWSNAYNGSYGSNGWEVVESIETLENQIKAKQEKIKLLKKITKNS